MESILRGFNNVDWITSIFVMSLFILVLSKTFFYNKFINFVVLPFNNKYIFLHSKKHILFNWFNILWSAFTALNISLFVYYILQIIVKETTYQSTFAYFTILCLVVLFFMVKILLQFGNAFVFNSTTTVTEFIFKKLSYLNHSAIIIFIANIFLTYITPNSAIIIYIGFVLVLAINVIGWVNLLKNHRKFLTLNFLYFILYLCALEISPLIIIGNYLKD
ncbi:DUF4271 domain-containing protein [Cellulophaga sp. F20128]|uniref:DUF4271 domain-containing protein n=1 Tax=Cellulophaga sp. F20128 TaxID=2926413 RepID=UPI00248AFFF9|nr:DUF4271 domain-containing protein [Cellulophaga sp. F20128]